jgi:hypothetical protein
LLIKFCCRTNWKQSLLPICGKFTRAILAHQIFFQRNQIFLIISNTKWAKITKKGEKIISQTGNLIFWISEYHLSQTNFVCHIWFNSSDAYDFQNGFFLGAHYAYRDRWGIDRFFGRWQKDRLDDLWEQLTFCFN